MQAKTQIESRSVTFTPMTEDNVDEFEYDGTNKAQVAALFKKLQNLILSQYDVFGFDSFVPLRGDIPIQDLKKQFAVFVEAQIKQKRIRAIPSCDPDNQRYQTLLKV